MATTRLRGLRKTVFVLIIVGLTLLCIELIVRLAAAAGLCQIRTFQVASGNSDIKYVGDINRHFGVWHIPDAAVTVNTPQGRISYRSNSHGMRDRPRDEKSAARERVVVLGDSFIEGSFVEEEDRITNVLEERTGIEFLNFGTSGSFGSIQEWLLYQHLASRFDHTRVLVFLLPDNDFADNDPTHQKVVRYRPYLRKTADSYELAYPTAFENAPKVSLKMPKSRQRRHKIYNNWYSLNLLVYRDASGVTDRFKSHDVTSSYDEFSEEDLNKLVFSYQQIIELAKPRPVTIFVIPRDRDFMAYEAGRFEGKIIKALSAFDEKNDGVEVVDLMPTFLAYMKDNNVSYKPFFLKFDAHWSPLGHQVAASAVMAHLRNPDGRTWQNQAPNNAATNAPTSPR